MLKLFVADLGGAHVDTARIYAGGKTEPILGNAVLQLEDSGGVLLGSKAHPSQPGGLSSEGILGQLEASLDSLKVGAVHEYYLHQPDENVPLVESLGVMHDLVENGTIKKIGMSNYHASEMQRAFHICEERGWHKPAVYQGLYNPLNRMVEEELIPILRENSCSFIAYNPLAAGLLTGRHSIDKINDAPVGRFKDNPNYLPRFYTKANFDAMEQIRQACDSSGLSMVSAAYRWLLQHSALSSDDGILLGASSMNHLTTNLEACADETPLPVSVKEAFDGAAIVANSEQGAFPYWRSYSSDMPGRDELDQGASYSATKK